MNSKITSDNDFLTGTLPFIMTAHAKTTESQRYAGVALYVAMPHRVETVNVKAHWTLKYLVRMICRVCVSDKIRSRVKLE